MSVKQKINKMHFVPIEKLNEMKWEVILFACLCFLNSYGECKWKPNNEKHSGNWQETANTVPTRAHQKQNPPDHTKLIAMARYVLHNADWASLATISVLPAIEGFPFSNVKSVVDGSLANSTGIPYFYISPLDFSAKDLTKNNRATVLVSLEETRYCENNDMDPEDPRCTRLMLSGKMKKLREKTPEYTFAKAALFERHPAMANFPPDEKSFASPPPNVTIHVERDEFTCQNLRISAFTYIQMLTAYSVTDHDWFVAKLKIAQIAMVDWYGGAKFIPVRDYLAYNYTGTEMLQYHNQHIQQAIIP